MPPGQADVVATQVELSCTNIDGVEEQGQTALIIACARHPPTVRLHASASSPQLPSSALVALLLEQRKHALEVGFLDIGPDPHGRGVRECEYGFARPHDGPNLACARQDDPVSGRVKVRVY